MKSALACLCLAVAVLACGGAGGESMPPDADHPAAAPAGEPRILNEEARTALPVAFGLPRVAAIGAFLSRALVVEAVYQATALSGAGQYGRVMYTGTLQPAAAGYFQYLPQPADRLVVRLGGKVHEFVIEQAQGNPQAMNSAAWLMSPHTLKYRHVIPGEIDVRMAVQYDGARFQAEVSGSYVQAGTPYELSLHAAGGSAGERGFHGQDVQTAYDLTGTVRGPGLEIEVHERHTSQLSTADSVKYLLPSQRGNASRFHATIGNVLRIGGDEYRFQNVQVRTDQSVRRGQGWAGLSMVAGRVLRNRKSLGDCVLQNGRAYLQTAAGPVPLDLPPPPPRSARG